ncbi:ABC transporter ATP-binding protein [Roseicyclus marinus]|uniref:ABC transporter ATP-binding protein n=1 Tax=Roseicyclus marinus TaxID=2161673 RepID=A0AA48KIL2_9RHOB|nr:ABC transporter ATP-binding protein [Roseicyclus marinus]
MSEIRLQQLGHSYRPNPTKEEDFALKPVDLTWADGKTYALLGPSGCGKTTMLNIISGLLKPSHGRLWFDGQDVTGKSTSERNIAQVFQFPVIYATKTVGQNLAFPLECRNWDTAAVNRRVAEIADLLELRDMLSMPALKLSADQKQLISLGRGLVRPDVSAILLDEPLTVIDPQLKFALRRKLREINRATGVTMILVTHDQAEAMSFADEIVVMRDGRVQQFGEPAILFERPANEFVGYFIGSPPMNMLALAVRDGGLVCPALECPVPGILRQSSGTLRLGLRAERIQLIDPRPDTPRATVVEAEILGVEAVITLRTETEEPLRVKTRHYRSIREGDVVGLAVDPVDMLVYSDGDLLGAN